ncbi:hypothetical protein ACFY64_31710 [Streptomyces collinus]|uniref:hypothetical protein n=1 Tax=Streptomyces collinus TaxID=42684 RepID=UPI00367BAF12
MHPGTICTRAYVKTPRPSSEDGYEFAAFKEIVVGKDVYATGYVSAWEADLMIGRTAAKGRAIHVREYGALVLAGRVSRSRTLEMAVGLDKLSARQAEDLSLIDRQEKDAHLVRDEHGWIRAVDASWFRIPQPQAGILLERGWLSRPPHSDRVWISAAGRMAMARHWHREQGLHWRVLKGLYLDAALTAAATARTDLTARTR